MQILTPVGEDEALLRQGVFQTATREMNNVVQEKWWLHRLPSAASRLRVERLSPAWESRVFLEALRDGQGDYITWKRVRQHFVDPSQNAVQQVYVRGQQVLVNTLSADDASGNEITLADDVLIKPPYRLLMPAYLEALASRLGGEARVFVLGASVDDPPVLASAQVIDLGEQYARVEQDMIRVRAYRYEDSTIDGEALTVMVDGSGQVVRTVQESAVEETEFLLMDYQRYDV